MAVVYSKVQHVDSSNVSKVPNVYVLVLTCTYFSLTRLFMMRFTLNIENYIHRKQLSLLVHLVQKH